jgi:YVTN family beta-propeller protein
MQIHPPARVVISTLTSFIIFSGIARASSNDYWICVTNEKGGDVSIIDGDTLKVIDSIPIGKRPRGIHPSPDGRTLYVALSGRPIEPPPQLDAQGNPIFKKNNDDDEEKNSDHAADGIGVIDLQLRKFVRRLPAGSDPEQFAVAPDGQHLCISNEDVATMSVTNVQTGKVESIVPVTQEPEGIAFTPDGKSIFVTCETNGDVLAVDARTFKITGQFKVPPRPRNITFLPDGSRAFVPSESSGQLSLIDPVACKVLKTVQLPTGSRPMALLTNPAGKKLYISTGRGGTVLIIDTETLSPIGTIRVGKRPWGLAISPDGQRVFVANGPGNDISVIDTSTAKEITRIQAGESPWGVTVVAVPKQAVTGAP